MVEQVVCRHCGEVKPRAEFSVKVSNGRLRDGRPRGTCRSCRAAYKKRRNHEAGRTKPGPQPRARPTPAHWAEQRWRLLEAQNARQAWCYWIEFKAPEWWKQRYHEARPKAPGGTWSEVYRWRYKNDPAFRLSERIRFRMKKKANGRRGEAIRAALKGKSTGTKLAAWLGYTMPELKAHLVRQFTKGMTWDRFCTGEIHIDHIVPLAAFDLGDPAEIKAAWALSNLRPMWGPANAKKGARRDTLL